MPGISESWHGPCIYKGMDHANKENVMQVDDSTQRELERVGTAIEDVNDEIWQYTRYDLEAPAKLLKRRAGLRSRITKLLKEQRTFHPPTGVYDIY